MGFRPVCQSHSAVAACPSPYTGNMLVPHVLAAGGSGVLCHGHTEDVGEPRLVQAGAFGSRRAIACPFLTTVIPIAMQCNPSSSSALLGLILHPPPLSSPVVCGARNPLQGLRLSAVWTGACHAVGVLPRCGPTNTSCLHRLVGPGEAPFRSIIGAAALRTRSAAITDPSTFQRADVESW